MTKEERLASVGLPNTPAGVAQFYDLFPDMESHDNYLANGGQPTAKEFFNFGATTNLNIPFGNFAYGGGPCMDCGGYMQKGGNPNFMDTINGITKANRKTFKSGSTIQGGANNNIGENRIADFKGTLATNAHNALLKEEQANMLQQFLKHKAQYGGDSYGQPVDQINYQNLAIKNMYQQHLDQSDANLKNDAGNLFQGLADMNSPENMNSSTKITQAQYGMPVGPNLKGGLTPEQQYMLKMSKSYVPGNAKENTKASPKYVGNQQTQNPVAAAYANYYLQEYQNKHFGPWGKTRMTFGTNIPNGKGVNQSHTGDPSKRPYQVLTDDQLFQINAANSDAPQKNSWFNNWMANRQVRSENKKAEYKMLGIKPGENRADLNYEDDMPEYEVPKKMTDWSWRDADETVSKQFGGPSAGVQYDQFGNPIDPNKQMMKQNTFGSNSTDNMFGTNNIFKGDNTRNTFGTPKPQEQNNQGTQGNSSFTVENKYGPSLTGPAAASTLLAGVNTMASMFEKRDDKAFKEKMNQMTLADNAFIHSPINSQSRGDYDPNSGMFRVDQHVPTRFTGYTKDGGETNLPTAKDGFNMRAGLYGTNGNRQFSLPMNTQAFSKAPISVRQTLEPVDKEDANLEAEKGETAILNVGGIPAHFTVGGKRHSQGGTPLSLPDDSFVFSDTKGMLIKDPIMLAQFGMVPTKAGYTPADIAKKFDINKFRKILSDSDSEALEIKTAEMMIANYNMKLAKLALLQESMKGFPQGIPKIAMPYIEATGLDPAELIGGPNQSGVAQVDPNMIPVEQGQQDEPDQDMGVARYGGLMKAQNGGLAKKTAFADMDWKDSKEYDFEKDFRSKQIDAIATEMNFKRLDGYTGKQWNQIEAKYKPFRKSNLAKEDLENMERTLLVQIKNLRENNLPVPNKVADTYNDVKSQLDFFVEKKNNQNTHSSNSDDKMSWITSEGKPLGKVDQNSTGYLNRVAQHWSGLNNIEDTDINTLNKVANNEILIPKGGLKVQTLPQQNLKKMWQNVNPFDEYKTEGAWDYTKKLVGAPLKLVNNTLTGNVETPGTTYIRTHEGARVAPFLMDVAMDPLTYVGPGAVKAAGKATIEGVKQIPKAYAWARYLVPEWGTAIKEFAVHYGPKVAEQITKGLKAMGPAAQHIGPSALTRFISTDYGDIETLMRNGEKVDQATVDKMIKEAIEKEKQQQKNSLLVKKPVVKKDSVATTAVTTPTVQGDW